MRPLYIFDLDGTLALTEHRQHILDSGTSDRWNRFFAACVDDKPNIPVILTMQALRKAGAEIWVWSGRSNAVRPQTKAWLIEHCNFSKLPYFQAPEKLRMREADDYTPDEQLKAQWLSEIEPPEWARLTAVFDDRQKVVNMWRANGVACFQVAPGDF